jgi:hypothetical protein
VKVSWWHFFIIIIQLLFSSYLLTNTIPDLATSFRNNYDLILRKLQGVEGGEMCQGFGFWPEERRKKLGRLQQYLGSLE